MTLIKSKINSLAWLKSAIYISVVGGVILSSKSASAATFINPDTVKSGTYSITLDFSPDGFPPPSGETGNFWKATSLEVTAKRFETYDLLAINHKFQHIKDPDHKDEGGIFNSILSLSSTDEKDPNTGTVIRTIQGLLNHEKHSDFFVGRLTAIIGENRILNWTFEVTGQHREEPVPEPTTIFGSALALGVGGWLKRKKSSQ